VCVSCKLGYLVGTSSAVTNGLTIFTLMIDMLLICNLIKIYGCLARTVV